MLFGDSKLFISCSINWHAMNFLRSIDNILFGENLVDVNGNFYFRSPGKLFLLMLVTLAIGEKTVLAGDPNAQRLSFAGSS